MLLFEFQRISVACLLSSMAIAGTASSASPNVLFIAVDDLRPELGCYGADHIHSPNIDRLAADGRLFQRAYCQQAVCNPSRSSLMTGLRPDTIGVTGNHSHFRDQHPGVVTLPQHFKQHGYHAAAIGKIYHGVFPEGASKTKWDTMGDPQSWSVPAIRFGPRYYYTEEGIAVAQKVYQEVYEPIPHGPDDWTKKLVFGLATEAPDVSDATLYDGKVADAAIQALGKLARQNSPFFLAVGFIKPHSPYVAPKKYFDLYRDVEIAEEREFPLDAPQLAGHSSGELRRYTDQPAKGAFPDDNQRELRRAYFACVSYIDAQIGRVLDELDKSGLSDNTIVVLYGDHGYHLGEQGLWGKTTNFELDTRVPLIVRTPGMNSPGRSSDSIVELIDLYPTLSQLAGLPIPEPLEGKSFAPILDDPRRSTKAIAFSQYPRRGGVMGYSLRTHSHRLTQWVDQESRQIRATELYDYTAGGIESKNIASESTGLVRELSQQLISFHGQIATEDVQVIADPVSEPVSFEQGHVGPLETLETTIGTWRSNHGVTRIDGKHAKSGDKCLHMTGGDDCKITLQFADHVDTRGVLSFSAERWTRRSPFSFRIERDSGNGWEEIYNGDQEIKVGRGFLSDVRVPLNESGIKRLRMSVTSPPNTGVLLDDFRVTPPRPQEIVDVRVVPHTLPVLIGQENSRLLKLEIEAKGNLNPIALTEVRGRLTAEDMIDNLSIEGADGDAMPLVESNRLQSTIDWSTQGITLVEGRNTVWLSCRVKRDADIDQKIGMSLNRVAFSNGESFTLQDSTSTQRMGVAVRQGGDDGVNTFRIPGLATTTKGTLIGVYDVRHQSRRDLPGDIDVGMSRSTDGGRTWEPMRIIMDMGRDPKWQYDGIGDPAVLVDQNTGTIWVAATWSHGNRSWHGSGQGVTAEETGQLMLVRSDDDGVTWSEPINITQQVKRPEWCFVLQGPGKGITMRDGTLVFAAQYQDEPEKNRLPHSTIIYSRDHGDTWQVGSGAFDDTTEAQVVEIEPGVLMLNCRYNRKATRVVMTTHDMGRTWQSHATSLRSLIEPGACMASLIDVERELGHESLGWLLFSNPDSTLGRSHITIKASPDRGLKWPARNRLLLDEGAGSGYSCMSIIDGHMVGILYEGSQAQLTFQRIPLSELTSRGPPRENIDKTGKTELKLPKVFGDHMVMQADVELPVWGGAIPNRRVRVSLGDSTLSTVADAQGKWQVRFPPRSASSRPVSLVVEADRSIIRCEDVLIGEVWLCAGQSNMEWTLSQSHFGEQELLQASDPNLRLLHRVAGARGSSGNYTEKYLQRLVPEEFCEGSWQVASSESAKNFSAVAWYFGKYLRRNLHVPIGLVCPAVGGTPTEAWIPTDAMQADESLRPLVTGNWLDNKRLSEFCRTRGEQNLIGALQSGVEIPSDGLGPNHSFKPGFMWEAAIQPLIPFAIRGVIWYQGESNAESQSRAVEHQKLLSLLIRQWRSQWGQGDFPFYFVQLPAMQRPHWPLFREMQRRLLDQLPRVGMAVSIDTGDRDNVHPAKKRPIGERLAKLALDESYRLKEFETSGGPLIDRVEQDGEGLAIKFRHVGDGLQSSDGKPLRHFEVRERNGSFHAANAEIRSNNTLVLSSPHVAEPSAARYAWLPFPDPPVNFFNSANVPASPFSTEPEPQTDEPPKISKPNILLIVSEDNSDHLGCYGEQRVYTPHLDALAACGVRYTRAYVPYSVCSPSRAAFLTGLYTRQTGHIGLATHRFAMYRDFKTMPAYFQQAGYYTGFLGKTHINPERLVEDFVDHRAIKNSNFSKSISIEQYAKEAHQVMLNSAAENKPFLLIINYADAHRKFVGRSKNGFPTQQVTELVEPFPWIGSDSPYLRSELRDYFNCMNRLDEAVGMVLDQLELEGERENTLVIYISDHGADFPRGKGSVYENGTRIPMIVNFPSGFSEGKVEPSLVSTVDLLPTMLRAAGLPIPDDLPGVALQDVDSGVAKNREYVHTFTTGSSPNLLYVQFGIRDDRYKLIYNPDRALNRLAQSRYTNSRLPPEQQVESFLRPPEYELYDLESDPYEWQNLADSAVHQTVRQRLLSAMRDFQHEIKDPFIASGNVQSFIAEQKEYQSKPYKLPGFRWPHLDMFENANNDSQVAR